MSNNIHTRHAINRPLSISPISSKAWDINYKDQQNCTPLMNSEELAITSFSSPITRLPVFMSEWSHASDEVGWECRKTSSDKLQRTVFRRTRSIYHRAAIKNFRRHINDESQNTKCFSSTDVPGHVFTSKTDYYHIYAVKLRYFTPASEHEDRNLSQGVFN